MTSLFTSRRFFPLFVSQISGIAIDNIYRISFILLFCFASSSASSGLSDSLRNNLNYLSSALLVLPYFLFSSIAGGLCDKHCKSQMVKYLKVFELAIIAFGSYALVYQNIPLMLATIFLLGTHTTFLSPLKLSLMPEYLEKNELIKGNAYMEMGTFSAILLGEIYANVLLLPDWGPTILIGSLATLSTIGFITSLYLPDTAPKNPDAVVNYNIFSGSIDIVRHTRYSKSIYLCILGVSWFWLVSGIVLNEIPVLINSTINAHRSVFTLSLVMFGVGIASGSLLCNTLLKNRIAATYVPIAAFGLSFILYDLASIIYSLERSTIELSFFAFLSHWKHWRILGDFYLIGFFGGLYHVPLYSLIQHESPEKERARIIACHNIISTAFMISGSILNSVLSYVFHGHSAYTFAFVSAIFAWLALYISQIMPYDILQTVLRFAFNSIYRTKLVGIENYNKVKNDPLVIIANHTSWLDAILLAAFFPDKLTFALNSTMTEHWLIRFFVKLNKVYLIDPTQAMSLRGLIESVKAGEKVVIFPEGRLTATGSIMKIYEAPAMVAHKTGAKILPVHIKGMQHSVFTRMRYKVLHLWPQVQINITAPHTFKIHSDLDNRAKRKYASSFLYKIMTEMSFTSNRPSTTLFDALLQAGKNHGLSHKVIDDISRTPTSYRTLIQKTFILRSALRSRLKNDFIGILLPTFTPTLINVFSIQTLGKTPVLLNFTHGAKNLLECCHTTNTSEIITSRKFIAVLQIESIIDALKSNNIDIIYLEDIKDNLSGASMAIGYLAGYFPALYRHYIIPEIDCNSPAVILFTSGSEGQAKGVALSHSNITANITQLNSVLDLNRDDKIFNALPLFHSFGLVGALLPLLSGVQVFLYPRALHYRLIAELIYETNSTILFGTDYILNLYAQHANSYDFYSLRYVFAGAEKLQQHTAQLWFEKFGIRILEGYGLTEASPGVSFNTPMHNKKGTVGRILPQIEYKIEPINGIHNGGKMWIRGPNIMLGYMLHSNPGVISPPKDGWHNTGDITHVDQDGFCSILGRVKRFAKIAGEMISLTAVEQAIGKHFPSDNHAILTSTCPKRGEVMTLYTESQTLTKPDLQQSFSRAGIAELWLPKNIVHIAEIPRFPTGKTNYTALKQHVLVQETEPEIA